MSGLIEDRLAASLRMGAFDGDVHERGVAQRQAREAVTELTRMRAELAAEQPEAPAVAGDGGGRVGPARCLFCGAVQEFTTGPHWQCATCGRDVRSEALAAGELPAGWGAVERTVDRIVCRQRRAGAAVVQRSPVEERDHLLAALKPLWPAPPPPAAWEAIERIFELAHERGGEDALSCRQCHEILGIADEALASRRHSPTAPARWPALNVAAEAPDGE